jgi:hypothetical protein
MLADDKPSAEGRSPPDDMLTQKGPESTLVALVFPVSRESPEAPRWPRIGSETMPGCAPATRRLVVGVEARSNEPSAVIEPHVLGNRYELRDILGAGGMGRVWRAWDALLRREVAVKTMGEGLANDRSFRLRFEREAQHAASLNHPNIVQVHDYGINGPTPYIVMELVSGDTLDELISDHRLLDPASTVRIADDVLGALEHAHHHHIVHRDVKPQNILIADDGLVKVTDFGLAKSVTDADLTLAGNVLGTPTYISPEQASDDPQTASSDLYSLGCVLYQCLAGRPPFVGQSKVEVVDMHLHTEAPPLRALRPDLAPTLEAPIMRSLAKDPRERFKSAREMSAALEVGLTATPDLTTRTPRDAVGTTPIANTKVLEKTAPAIGRTRRRRAPRPAVVRPRRRRLGRFLRRLAVTGLLVALLATGFLWLTASRPEVDSNPGEVGRTRSVRLTSFAGASLSVKYPRGWEVTSAEKVQGGLVATEIENPNAPSELVKVHVVTAGDPTPEDLLRENRDNLSDEPRYEELAVRRFAFTPSDGRIYPAILWEFRVWDIDRSVMLRKTDVFFTNPAGEAVALLTQARAAAYPRWRPTFDRIRRSVAFAGNQGA